MCLPLFNTKKKKKKLLYANISPSEAKKKKKERQAYKNKGILRQPYLTFPA